MIDKNFIGKLDESRMQASSLLCCWEDKEARDVCVRLDLAYRDLEGILFDAPHHYRFSYKVFEEFVELDENYDHPNSKPKIEYYIQYTGHSLSLFIMRDGISKYNHSLWENLSFLFGPEFYDDKVEKLVNSKPTEEFLKIFPNAKPLSLSDIDSQIKFYFKGLCQLPAFIDAYIDYLEGFDAQGE